MAKSGLRDGVCRKGHKGLDYLLCLIEKEHVNDLHKLSIFKDYNPRTGYNFRGIHVYQTTFKPPNEEEAVNALKAVHPKSLKGMDNAFFVVRRGRGLSVWLETPEAEGKLLEVSYVAPKEKRG